jgi:glycosyltransferase involved in cell wall biosynthesis
MTRRQARGGEHDAVTDIDERAERNDAPPSDRRPVVNDGERVAVRHGPAPMRAARRVQRSERPTLREPASSPLRVAMLAPPWIPVPAPGYGGIEAVVEVLCDRLVANHHEVTLFAAAGSRSPAKVHALLARPFPEAMGRSLYEADHVARAFEEIDKAAYAGRPFDLVHDHSGFTALAMADRLQTPVVHTVHGEFTDEIRVFYAHHARKALVVALSASQRACGPPELAAAPVIPNPIDLRRWPFVPVKNGYLLWVGRLEAIKGPHRAIDVATRTGRRIVLAGPVQPGQEGYFAERIAPRVDNDRVCYVGEVTGRAKVELFAHAAALLMPIRWEEPFGLVMIEALACGSPVIAFAEGAADEIVLDGQNGFLVDDEDGMTAAIANLGLLDPATCRASVAARYDAGLVTRAYEDVYRRACAASLARRPTHSGRAAGDDPPRTRAGARPRGSAPRRG